MSRFTSLKMEAYNANMEIPRKNLAIGTWGNVSVMDKENKVFAIKPSGVLYSDLKAEDMVVVDLENTIIEGNLNPSSDTRTHVVLYRAFAGIGSIVHTHSSYAVGWAQALTPIPLLGTTHADHAASDIPCTDPLTDDQIIGDYEEETGNQIVNYFETSGLDPRAMEMILVGRHGPFTWGKKASKAVDNAVVLEELAKMAFITKLLNPDIPVLGDVLGKKHYERKNGKNGYYGQA